MTKRSHVIAERILRDFIRNSFGTAILSEGLVGLDTIPGTPEYDAATANKKNEEKQEYLKAAQDFVDSKNDDLKDVLDDLEGVYIGDSLERLQQILNEAMALDDRYKQEDSPKFATVLTCYAVVEGDASNIPWFFGKIADILASGKRVTSRDVSLNEATLSAEEKISKVVEQSIGDMIPAVLQGDQATARKIVNTPGNWDATAAARYGETVVDSRGMITTRNGKLSFNQSLENALKNSIKVQIPGKDPIPLKDVEAFIASLDGEIDSLRSNLDTKQAMIDSLEKNGTNSGNLYNQMVEDLSSIQSMIDQRMELKKSVRLESQNLTDEIRKKIEDKDFIIGKIREFASQGLSGPSRIAVQYPKLSRAGSELDAFSKTLAGKALIAALSALAVGAGGSAGLYAADEALPVKIKRINGAYEDFMQDSVETVAQMFEDNEYFQYAGKLRNFVKS